MFKIFENNDGTTTIYCTDSGNVLCSVPNTRDKPLAEIQHSNTLSKVKRGKKMKRLASRKKRPKGIGRPIPRQKTHSSSDSKCIIDSHGQDLKCQIVALPWVEGAKAIVDEKYEVMVKEDLTLDQEINNISHAEFLQIVGLCPKSMADDGTWKELREKLPTRSISRPLKEDFKIGSPEVPDVKIYEECSISAPLTLKWLKETPEGQKKQLDSNAVSMSIKKYETFCKFAIGSPYTPGNGYPYSMRCREIKKYPVTYKPLKIQTCCHKYCFTSEDYLERRKYLRTGLNKRSRQLKQEVCKRTPIVRLSKLTEEEINWTTQSSNPVDEGRNSTLKIWSRFGQDSTPRLSEVESKEAIQRLLTHESRVNLTDISKRFEIKGDTMYLRGTMTTVRMPAASSKHSFHSNRSNHNGVCLRVAKTEHYDHPYHRTILPVHNVSERSTSSLLAKRPHLMINKSNKKISKVSRGPSIPVIDLSSDDEVPKNSLQLSTPSSFNFIFKCFGCNLKSCFRSKELATAAVQVHMETYHAVAEPKAFLSAHLNHVTKVLLIEAFPGYKQMNTV